MLALTAPDARVELADAQDEREAADLSAAFADWLACHDRCAKRVDPDILWRGQPTKGAVHRRVLGGLLVEQHARKALAVADRAYIPQRGASCGPDRPPRRGRTFAALSALTSDRM